MSINKKKQNREELQRIADVTGDRCIMVMFWDMFDDLSLKNQKHYIERAKRIVKDETGLI